MSNKPLLDGLDPELVRRMTSDKQAIWEAGRLGVAVDSPSIGLGALSGTAFGVEDELPQQIIDVLNFALLLELREDELYRIALDTKGLIPERDRKVFERVGKNEAAHVKLLREVLGKNAIPKPEFDHTAKGMFPDIFSKYETFTAVSQVSEETGVRAYKGQAGNLMSNDKLLTTALRIHSVEARHVSMIRRVRGQKGWITGDSRGNLPPPTQPTYDGEGNMTHAGVNLSGVAGLSDAAVTESFDEPLTKEEVMAIVRPFIRG